MVYLTSSQKSLLFRCFNLFSCLWLGFRFRFWLRFLRFFSFGNRFLCLIFSQCFLSSSELSTGYTLRLYNFSFAFSFCFLSFTLGSFLSFALRDLRIDTNCFSSRFRWFYIFLTIFFTNRFLNFLWLRLFFRCWFLIFCWFSLFKISQFFFQII